MDETDERTIRITLGGATARRVYEGVTLRWATYLETIGGVAVPVLQLYTDEGYGPELLATATVYLEGIAPEPGCIIVKNYSENEGMYESLVAALVIEPTDELHTVGPWDAQCREGRVLSPYAADLAAALAERN